MPSHRSERMAEAIREVVAEAVLFQVADPRVRSVTVLRTELSGDLRHATVYVSVMGSESERKTALRGLSSASGFLQSRVAARLQTRFTPALSFKLDEGARRSVEMSKLIEETLAADRANRGDEPEVDDLGEDDEDEFEDDELEDGDDEDEDDDEADDGLDDEAIEPGDDPTGPGRRPRG